MRQGWKLLTVVLASLVLAPAAGAQTTLRYKFKEGEKIDYVVNTDQKSAMSLLGKKFDITNAIALDMTWHTVKVDAQGNAEVKVTISRAKMTMEGGPLGKIELDSKDTGEPENFIGQKLAGMVKAMGSMAMTFKVDPTGAMTDIKVSEGTAKKQKAMPGFPGLGGDTFGPETFKSTVRESIIVPLPKDAIAKGKTWSEKADQKTGFGRMTGETKYTYDGVIEKGGKRLDKIAVKPDLKIMPAEGSPVQVKMKSGSSKGVVLFDNTAGRIAQSRTDGKMELEIEAAGMTVEASVTQNVTVRLKGPAKTGEKK